MHLTLLIPDLIPPPGFIAEPDLPALPGLQALLAQGTIKRQPGRFLEEACLHELGLKYIASNPVAALSLLADGGQPGDDMWLRADPVHLHISRDNVQLMDSHVIEPTLDEAHAIATTLNHHLATGETTRELVIEVRDAARWYLKIPHTEMPETTALWRASGANVFDHLPENTVGNINWRSLQNELQMLLHDHPVNLARLERNTLPINGIWFWGGGTFRTHAPVVKAANTSHLLQIRNARNMIMPPTVRGPAQAEYPYRLMLAKLALARGLAINNKLPVSALPINFAQMPLASTHNFVVLHQPTRALRANQRHEWMTAVSAIDTDWLQPLKAALIDRTIESLTLLLPNEAATLRVHVVQPQPWEFWKILKPMVAKKPLAKYVL